MTAVANPWLVAAGACSALAAVVHFACIFGGPDWYRFLGAGERMARAAGRGDRYPSLITMAIATMLSIWAAYAWSGAGLIGRLPLLRLGLIVITALYLVRGLVFVRPSLFGRPDWSESFLLWSSLIVLGIGGLHLIGLVGGWNKL